MEPNDLPIVCLPLELSGDAAEKLIDFLYQLTRPSSAITADCSSTVPTSSSPPARRSRQALRAMASRSKP
jgi:hypothetical protein